MYRHIYCGPRRRLLITWKATVGLPFGRFHSSDDFKSDISNPAVVTENEWKAVTRRVDVTFISPRRSVVFKPDLRVVDERHVADEIAVDRAVGPGPVESEVETAADKDGDGEHQSRALAAHRIHACTSPHAQDIAGSVAPAATAIRKSRAVGPPRWGGPAHPQVIGTSERPLCESLGSLPPVTAIQNIKVASGLVRRGGEVLVVGEDADRTAAAGLPGGVVEPGEFFPDACAREIFEETGVNVTKVGSLLWTVEYRLRSDDVDAVVTGMVFEVEEWDGEPGGEDPDGVVTWSNFVPMHAALDYMRRMTFSPMRVPALAFLEGIHPAGAAWLWPSPDDLTESAAIVI